MKRMDCTDIKALLSALVDDEIDVTRRHEAERHLAGCDACRALVGEAEALDDLVARDVESLVPASLPSGFEGAVLARTVYDERAGARGTAPPRLATWLGWLAAAACLALASTLWVLDQQRRSARSGGSSVVETAPVPAARPAAYRTIARSEVLDVALPVSALPSLDAADERDAAEIDAAPADAGTAAPSPAPISADDADALYAAALLLDQLRRASDESFADVERVRRIAEYDDVLERLADARQRLAMPDRAHVHAAESLLTRIVNGPVSLADVRDIRRTVARLELPDEMDELSSRWAPSRL